MKKLSYFIGLVAFLCVVTVQANTAPEDIIRQTTDKVVSELQTNRAAMEQDRTKLYAMVDKLVLPHFSFEKMSRLVLGRYWKKANPEQQGRFVAEFRNLLVRTYASALFEYTGKESLDVKPASIDESKKKALVKSEFKFSNGSPPIPVNYSFVKENSGDWKVFDVSIDGISLVTNYRTSYGQIIRQNGMDALINSLVQKNAENGGSANQ